MGGYEDVLSGPDDEDSRLDELESYDILDTAPESIYDDLTYLASQTCGTEIAAISLIDEDRQWFKSKRGIEADMTSREDAFCAQAVCNPSETMVVEDATTDERFQDNPYVTGDPNIRFYAGSPLKTPNGRALGTLCAISSEPKELTETEERGLQALSRMVMTQLELRRRTKELRDAHEQLEEQARDLKRSNEELDNFAGTVSHELKDPLAQVVSNLDLLDLTAEDLDPEAREHLNEAVAGGERMEELINDLLRYSRAGKAEANIETVPADDVVDKARKLVDRQIQETGAEITTGTLPSIQADRALLRQVFRNLFSNAIKYCDEETPRIHVNCEDTEDGWRFTVEDNGIGIPETEQDRLFNVFERCPNAGGRQGTGVGLVLSHRIVDRHGGSFGIESTADEGSTFWFTIPKPGSG